MMFLVDALLWGIVGALALALAIRSPSRLREGAREGGLDFIRLMPRLVLGVVGSGYIAEILPHSLMGRWLGPESGVTGVALAVVIGALTPGGPVVGFSIATAALKGGAGVPQVIAYSTAWALYAVHRIFMWELPVMPPRVVWLRAAASLPLPFLAAAGAMLLGKP